MDEFIINAPMAHIRVRGLYSPGSVVDIATVCNECGSTVSADSIDAAELTESQIKAKVAGAMGATRTTTHYRVRHNQN